MDNLYLEEYLEMGVDGGRGNLLGIQPYMAPRDYAELDTLFARLDAYLHAAGERGWIGKGTIAVLPEYTGAWLAATGLNRGIYDARTLPAAMRSLALSHPLATARAAMTAPERDRVTAAIFRLRAEEIARLYHAVFSTLARRYHVTLVAGSTILPEPRVPNGLVAPGSGRLYNVSVVFRPDGSPYPDLVRKVYPTGAEQPFLAAGRLADIPAFETPAGKLGVLVCADSWYPEAYARLESLGVDFVAVPSFTYGKESWQAPWGGYDGAPMPADVDPADKGRLTEGEAWRSHALAGRLASSGAKRGINVFLHGQLWDMQGTGCSVMMRDGEVMEAGGDGAALLNLWL